MEGIVAAEFSKPFDVVDPKVEGTMFPTRKGLAVDYELCEDDRMRLPKKKVRQ